MQSRQCSCPPREIRGGAGDIRSAIAIKSDYADAFNNRGVALLGLGRPLPALASYDKALSVRPDHAEALYNRGNLLRQLKRPLEALASYDQAIAIRPGYADAFNALQDLQRPWEAIASYDRSLAIRPTYVESYENKGILLAELGHLASAREALECAIRLDPRRTRSHFHLALVEKTRAGDRHLAVMEDLALRNDSLTVSEQIDLDFALGKAYEDCGDYERSFRFLAAGNALKRKNVVYHEKGALKFSSKSSRRSRAIRSADAEVSATLPTRQCSFSECRVRGRRSSSRSSRSYPRVSPPGKSTTSKNAIMGLRDAAGNALQYPESYSAVSDDALRSLGARYLQSVTAAAPAAARFFYAALIHLALPKARMIHARRDPICG